MPMIDTNMAQQLQAHFAKLSQPVEFVANLDSSKAAENMHQLLDELAKLSDKLSYRQETNPKLRAPSFSVGKAGEVGRIRFAGNPMGHEFTSLILAILQTGGHPLKLEPSQIEAIKRIPGPLNFETYMSLTCHNCPDVVQALNLMAILNPNIQSTVIDGGVYPDEVKQRNIMAVPSVFKNGELYFSGRRELAEILPDLDVDTALSKQQELNAKDAFDALIVGGGPAGATAAIYMARKGLRTGLVAQRLGGQVNETADIENVTGSPSLTGPLLAQRLEEHVRENTIDVMTPFNAVALGKDKLTGLWMVTLDNAAQLKAKVIILSTGAKWKRLNIEGEDAMMGKGICFCPHCDGPLFKGKDIVVIGGGNSGVEAAIDLAGIAKSVTLVHRRDVLTADSILQKRLLKFTNVKLELNQLTQRFIETNGKLTGIVIKDRVTHEERTIACEGAFIQIGLTPNTEWLANSVSLSEHSEIIVNSKGGTNLPGVFAAGDCTDAPYKQILTAMGQGATAALGAFDYLIRLEA